MDAHQRASGEAWENCLALASVIGCTRTGALRFSMEHETWMDLLAEQGMWSLFMGLYLSAARAAGRGRHPPEAVLLEMYVSREPAEMMERVAEVGLVGQLGLHSRSSTYGQTTRLEKLDRSSIQSFLREAREERIRTRRFDREWTEA